MPNNQTPVKTDTNQSMNEFTEFYNKYIPLIEFLFSIDKYKDGYWNPETNKNQDCRIAHIFDDGRVIALNGTHFSRTLQRIANLSNISFTTTKFNSAEDVLNVMNDNGFHNSGVTKFFEKRSDRVLLFQFEDLHRPVEFYDEAVLLDLADEDYDDDHFFKMDNPPEQSMIRLLTRGYYDGIYIRTNNTMQYRSIDFNEVLELADDVEQYVTIQNIVSFCNYEWETHKAVESTLEYLNRKQATEMYLLTLENGPSVGPLNVQELHTSVDSALASVKERFGLSEMDLIQSVKHSDCDQVTAVFSSSDISFHIQSIQPITKG